MKIRYCLTFLSVFMYAAVQAQNVRDLIISEALVQSDSSVTDEYGTRSGWIEIFNTSYGKVNFAGCYFTDDKRDLKKSPVTKGDTRTVIGPRQVALFYADGKHWKGVFHTSFTLRNGSTVYLVSNDGKSIIDSLSIPLDLPAGKSVGKTAKDLRQMVFETEDTPLEPGPNVVNGDALQESNSEKMAREDRYGLILTLVSVSVVFISLAVLWFFFGTLGKSVNRKSPGKKQYRNKSNGKNAAVKAGGIDRETAAAISLALDKELNGEVYAAIAAAIDLETGKYVHDSESFVITIKQGNGNWRAPGSNFRKLPK